MARVHDDGDGIGFEEAKLWLPSHVLDEACDAKIYLMNRPQKHQQQGHLKRHGEPRSHKYSKSTSRSSSYQRPNHAHGGPGMQAIFLGSERSSGTGVFLPQRADTKPSKKPACAPILLPARVVQALNLNVHALGQQISPLQVKYNTRCEEVSNNGSKKNKDDQNDALNQFSVISQSESSSSEIFLPKEWTY